MKFKYIGDKRDNHVLKPVLDDDNNITYLKSVKDKSHDPSEVVMYGVVCPLNVEVELPREHELYENAKNKIENNPHFEVIRDTSGTKAKSAKAS